MQRTKIKKMYVKLSIVNSYLYKNISKNIKLAQHIIISENIGRLNKKLD